VQFWQAMAFLETEQLIALSRGAEECGFSALTVSDHIFFPEQLKASYPYTADGRPFWGPDTPWPDPWVAIGAMAAVTQRIRFTTNVYVAPARELFTVAKLVSTAAVLSGDRVALGAGAGWCRDEFDQMGQRFEGRGARLEEMVHALRKLWGGGMVEHHGEHYDFGPLQISPVPKRPIPVYTGGDSETALRRAVRIADGWIGNAYDAEAAVAVLERLDEQFERSDRSREGFETVLTLYGRTDPDLYRRFEDKGVTAVVCAPWMAAKKDPDADPAALLAARVAAMERFSENVVAKVAP
jgi:probable F420-dependent oxidoreductase